MPDLDLGPNDYRKQDPHTGRWRVPDDPKLARNMLAVPIVGLAYIFWNRAEISQELIMGSSVLLAFAAGILFANWLKNVY